MKPFYKILTLAVVISGFSLTTFAQSTTQATATAIIIAPISITKMIDFDFGWIATTPAGGTAVLTAGGVVSGTAGVRAVLGGSSNAASFDVTGEAGNLYTITWPVSVDLPRTVAGSTILTLGSFTTAASGGGTVGTLVTTAQTFLAGATLTVPANTLPGTYESGNFPVTITYN